MQIKIYACEKGVTLLKIIRKKLVYTCTKEAVVDLEKQGYLVRISDEVDPNLEMAVIQRRVYAAGGPAILFENVKGTKFPCVSNLF